MNICDRHVSKERRQISVFRHLQFAPLRPRIRIPERPPRPRSWSCYLAFLLIIAIEYSVNDASFVGPDGRRTGGGERRRDGGKDTEVTVVHEEEEDDEEEWTRQEGRREGEDQDADDASSLRDGISLSG